MSTVRSKRAGFLTAFLASAFLFLAMAPSALAGPLWRIDTLAPTTAPTATKPGETLRYVINLTNPGAEAIQATPDDPWKFKVTIPDGLEAKSFTPLVFPWSCDFEPGDSSFACESTTNSLPTLSAVGGAFEVFWLDVEVQASSGTLTPKFAISGGGAPPALNADPTTVTSELPGFGIDAFDEAAFADAAGTPSTQAAGRPYSLVNSIDYNTVPANPDAAPLRRTPLPAEPTKDVIVELPPGSIGNPSALAQCKLGDLVTGTPVSVTSKCPLSSQVGEMVVRLNVEGVFAAQGPFPVYNMVPPPGAPSRLAFNVYGVIVMIDTDVRSSGDYGLTSTVADISEGLPVTGTELTLWGAPAGSEHDFSRTCFGAVQRWFTGGGPCPSDAPETGFWRNPTSCEAEATGLPTTLHADSWFHPGEFDQRTIHSHLPPGYAFPESEWGAPQGPTGCSKVRFEPSIEATPRLTAPIHPVASTST